jgi:hypothetical protein
MWKRMCTRRGVTEEFERLHAAVTELGGSTAVSEYARILREFGADRPQQFKTSQTARLCAERVHHFLEELRARSQSEPNDAATTVTPNGEAAPEGESDAA